MEWTKKKIEALSPEKRQTLFDNARAMDTTEAERVIKLMVGNDLLVGVKGDPDTIKSSLSRTVTRNGITVEVEIYRHGNDLWTFKVLNENGISFNSTEDFVTDEDASQAFNAELEQDGIEVYLDDAPCPICKRLGLGDHAAEH